jgi:flagellar hook protein FlgE
MIRSMSSALSGMRAHQQMLDVVGNNISNVSTTGFKSSAVVFQDVLTQVVAGAGAPSTEAAGTNPAQIGLGVRAAGVAQAMTQGALQSTGRAGDMSIQGDGFFVLQQNGAETYTRAGNFSIDALGRLATVDGALVQGWQANGTGAINSNLPIGEVVIRVGDQLPPNQTTAIRLGGNIPADSTVGATVDSAVSIFDTEGNQTLLQITFTKTAAGAWTATAAYGPGSTPVALTDNALTFNTNGELTAPLDHDMNIAGGVIPGFAGALTISLGDTGTAGRVTQYAGKRSIVVTEQDGFASGVLQSYAVSPDGTMVGTYSNGRTQNIAQVALAVFGNPEGLERLGGVWRQTANSGLPQVGVPNAGGRGQINPSTLELSNVDLAQEFTNLIVAQRGFQANSRVITTSDDLLNEIVNLKRG